MLDFQKISQTAVPCAREQGDVLTNITNGEHDMPGKTFDSRQNGLEQEYIKPSDKSAQVRKTTIMVIIMLCVGLLCLWFMIKGSSPSKVVAISVEKEAQIETAIERLTGVRTEMSSRMDEIVEKFYHFSDLKQVGVEDLKKNPFVTEAHLYSIDGGGEFGRGDSYAEKLQLLSIMRTVDGYCCLINDKILYKGDSINGFLIRGIENKSVHLVSDTKDLTLKIIQ